jgi:hypothetical protein
LIALGLKPAMALATDRFGGRRVEVWTPEIKTG